MNPKNASRIAVTHPGANLGPASALEKVQRQHLAEPGLFDFRNQLFSRFYRTQIDRHLFLQLIRDIHQTDGR